MQNDHRLPLRLGFRLALRAVRACAVVGLLALSAAPLAGCGGDDTGDETNGDSTSSGGSGSSSGGGPCGVDGAGCFDYSSFDGSTPAVSFKADVLPILRQSCGLSSACHGNQSNPTGDRPYLGPALKDGEATDAQIAAIFDQNVNKAAMKEPKMKIVAPGDPANSFLLYKLDGTSCGKLACAASASCGTQMPQGGVMPCEQRDILRRWIAQGAKND